MNSKSDLFDLIKSLDKHEKRFLKLYVKLHNPNKLPQYLHLFEVFENMKRFDKTQMIAELSKVVSGVNIGQLKQYLKRNIFKALKVYDKKGSYNTQDNEDINTAKILIAKKLYKMAEKMLLKLRKTAIEQENSQLHIQTNTELIHIKNMEDKRDIKVINQIEKYYDESLFCIEELKEKKQLQQINIKASKFYYSKLRYDENIDKNYLKILEEDLSPFKSLEFLSKENAITYYNLFYTVNSLLNRNEDSPKAIEKAKKIIQSPVLENYPKCVATFYVNVLHSYIYNGMIEPFFPTLKKAQLFLDRHPTLIPTHQHIIYLRELEFYISVIEEKPGKKVFEKIITYIENNDNNVPLNYKNNLLKKIAICYFNVQDYATCQDVLLKITLENYISINEFYFVAVSLMEIICNYELGMLTIAKQRIEVFERKLGKIKTKNLMAIAQTLRLIVSSKKEKLEHFEQLNDFMPNDEGIKIISIDMSAVTTWVLHKIERLIKS